MERERERNKFFLNEAEIVKWKKKENVIALNNQRPKWFVQSDLVITYIYERVSPSSSSFLFSFFSSLSLCYRNSLTQIHRRATEQRWRCGFYFFWLNIFFLVSFFFFFLIKIKYGIKTIPYTLHMCVCLAGWLFSLSRQEREREIFSFLFVLSFSSLVVWFMEGN